MSKSLGNTVAPQDVIKQSGADILRLWVMATDYSDDQRIGKRSCRPTSTPIASCATPSAGCSARWPITTGDRALAASDMPELERLMLHRLAELDEVVREGLRRASTSSGRRALSDFMNVELSAFYFDIRKDALYCDVVPVKAAGIKCARSWKYFDPASADPDFPAITPRDAAAMREWKQRHAM
jgi:isoleucyl-tRNA synthetase